MTESKKENNDIYEFQGVGLKGRGKEKQDAKERFNNYRKKYHFDSISDLQLLEELVYRESLQERYKKKILAIANKKEVKEENVVPTYVLRALDENLSKQLEIKDKLGLFDTNKNDEYKAFEILEKKFEIWKEEHIEERKIVCPFCKEIFFLNIRTDKYIPSKLKLFKNKVLCNEELWKLYKEEGKITKDDMAKILNVSPDYIDWLVEHIYKDIK